MDSSSLYYYIFDVPDPEFPNSTLEDLGIVRPEGVTVDCCGYARVEIKPTVEYCSYVPMIALAIHERLLDEVPEEYKRLRLSLEIVDHRESDMYNKQINDKERVMAALERHLRGDEIY